MRDYEVIEKICECLWDSEDEDCMLAEEYGFKEQIIELFRECYDYEGFCKWLADHDCRIAYEFKQAEIHSRCDYESEEEWEDASDDALFRNEHYLCMRW